MKMRLFGRQHIKLTRFLLNTVLKIHQKYLPICFCLPYYGRMEIYDVEQEDKELKQVGLELMFLTPEKYSHEDGISAVELSKLLDMPVETVKRKLKILFDKGIIRVRGINPKLWKFDEFNFQRMDEDDEVYRLLCSFDDVDFDRYFTY